VSDDLTGANPLQAGDDLIEICRRWRLDLEADRKGLGSQGAHAHVVFTQGQCHALAAALAQLLDAPMVICHSYMHVGVEIAGSVLDIDGLTPRDEWIERWLRPDLIGVDEWIERYERVDEMLERAVDWYGCDQPDMSIAWAYAPLVIEQYGLQAAA
jgi:hypothetical protein